jgi:hypothetical protein
MLRASNLVRYFIGLSNMTDVQSTGPPPIAQKRRAFSHERRNF